MSKLKKSNIVNFPGKINNIDREVEAVVFAAAEPLSIETIESKISKKADVSKILEKLKEHYSGRGINLVCISKKWSFRTSENLSSLMSQQKPVEKVLRIVLGGVQSRAAGGGRRRCLIVIGGRNPLEGRLRVRPNVR